MSLDEARIPARAASREAYREAREAGLTAREARSVGSCAYHDILRRLCDEVRLAHNAQLLARRRGAALASILLLASCTEAATYGNMAATYRRTANDLQAQATLAAACDISVGAYWRLTQAQREAVDRLCAGLEMFKAPER